MVVTLCCWAKPKANEQAKTRRYIAAFLMEILLLYYSGVSNLRNNFDDGAGVRQNNSGETSSWTVIKDELFILTNV